MYRLLQIFILGIFLTMPAIGQNKTVSSVSDSVVVNASELADLIVSDAKKYLGRPYVWAANGPHAFDCSGLTKFIYAKFGYKLSRTVSGQMANGRQVKGGFHNLQKGDILIFGSRADKSRPGHVAIFIELDSTKNNFTFIHAASKGVRIEQYKTTYYRERFLTAVRIIPDFAPAAPEAPLTEEQLDSVYSNVVLPPPPDTLKLDPSDRRIILLNDGTWIIVGENGEIIQPKMENKDEVFLVYGNGTWRNIPTSERKIPKNREDIVAAQPAKPATPQPVKKYHTVKSGDTLYALAVFYKTKVSEICRLNGIKETDILKLGTKLRVK